MERRDLDLKKRKMLTFSISAQVWIESIASAFLLFGAYKLFGGAFDGTQTRMGSRILLVYAVVFLAGGIVGLIRSYFKYKKHKQEGER